jgi:hypothetical protein
MQAALLAGIAANTIELVDRLIADDPNAFYLHQYKFRFLLKQHRFWAAIVYLRILLRAGWRDFLSGDRRSHRSKV